MRVTLTHLSRTNRYFNYPKRYVIKNLICPVNKTRVFSSLRIPRNRSQEVDHPRGEQGGEGWNSAASVERLDVVQVCTIVQVYVILCTALKVWHNEFWRRVVYVYDVAVVASFRREQCQPIHGRRVDFGIAVRNNGVIRCSIDSYTRTRNMLKIRVEGGGLTFKNDILKFSKSNNSNARINDEWRGIRVQEFRI